MLGFRLKIIHMILSSFHRRETFNSKRLISVMTSDRNRKKTTLLLSIRAISWLMLSKSGLKLNPGLLPNGGIFKCQKMKMNERACGIKYLLTSKLQWDGCCFPSESRHVSHAGGLIRNSALQPLRSSLTDILLPICMFLHQVLWVPERGQNPLHQKLALMERYGSPFLFQTDPRAEGFYMWSEWVTYGQCQPSREASHHSSPPRLCSGLAAL